MVEAKISGSRIHHRRPLNTERCAMVNTADDLMILAPNDGWITHAAPGAGFCWVLGQVTVGFDMQPTGASHLEITYQIGAAAVETVFDSYIGGPECANGTNVSGINVFGFYFPVSMKFPANSEVIVTLYSGCAVTASSLNIISWVETEI